MSNLITKLINSDKRDFEKPSIVVELPRLSKILGEKFEVTIKTLPTVLSESIDEKCVKIKDNGGVDVDVFTLTNKTLLDSVYHEDKLLFRNTDLMSAFNAKTPYELMDAMLLTKEKEELYKAYKTMIDYDGKELVKKIKK